MCIRKGLESKTFRLPGKPALVPEEKVRGTRKFSAGEGGPYEVKERGVVGVGRGARRLGVEPGRRGGVWEFEPRTGSEQVFTHSTWRSPRKRIGVWYGRCGVALRWNFWD